MANILYGPLAQELSGTVGGVTFARSYTSKTCRGWRAPTNKRRALQITQRRDFSRSASRWFDVLSPQQRVDWDLYAPSCPFTNSLGQEYHLNGFNMYIRNNTILLASDHADLDDAPTLDGFPAEYNMTFYFPYDTGTLYFNDIDPVPPAGSWVLFTAHTLRKITRTFPYIAPVERLKGHELEITPEEIHEYGILPAAFVGTMHALVTWYIWDSVERLSTRKVQLVPVENPV